jgi:two-component system sensor histidine kinase KdpD
MGWVAMLVGLPLLTVALAALRGHISLPGDLLIYLLAVVAIATVGGAWPAAVAAVAAALLANWYFTPPVHTWSISDTVNVIALIVFLAVAAVVSVLVTLTARRSIEATRSRSEAATLVRLAGALLTEQDPIPAIMSQLRAAFNLRVVAVFHRVGEDSWQATASSGEPVPAGPGDADDTVQLTPDDLLAINGPDIGAEDRRILHGFTAQLAVALESRELRAEAAAASALAEADALRTALLRAVSHDLRTPLAAIKAAATTQLAPDLSLPPDEVQQLEETIDEEVDRLTELVTNLLDMSRLQTSSVHLAAVDVGVDEIVSRAVASLGSRGDDVVVDIPEDLPRLHADPALLERAFANVIDNALTWSPPGEPVRIEGACINGAITVCVVDRGPGIPVADRERVFQPFQRLNDRSDSGGVGLGLAVALGFVQAVDGTLTIDDTPGGGTTMLFQFKAD